MKHFLQSFPDALVRLGAVFAVLIAVVLLVRSVLPPSVTDTHYQQRAIEERGVAVQAVYSPVPLHEIEEVLSARPSSVRYFTLSGALLGIVTGIFLSVYTSLQWNFIVSAKPVVSICSHGEIVAFEFCILLAIVFNLVGMLVNSRLPRFSIRVHYDYPLHGRPLWHPGAVRGIRAGNGQTTILKAAGAEEVCHAD